VVTSAAHGVAEEGGGGSSRWLNPAVAAPGRWLKQGCECAWGEGVWYGGPDDGPLLWAGQKELYPF
jgi:hypothetical protein